MNISQAQLRRLERLERLARMQPPQDFGSAPAPVLTPDTLRTVLRMLAEMGGLTSEHLMALRGASDAIERDCEAVDALPDE